MEKPKNAINSMATPKETVLAYHDAFYRSDLATVRALLADEGAFIGPLSRFTDPDVFLKHAAVFPKMTKKTEIKQVIAEGDDVCVLYDATMHDPAIPTHPLAAWFKVRGGKIGLFHIHFDPTVLTQTGGLK
jgi:hypothetical protein